MNEENNYTEVNNKMIQDLFEECWDDLETGKMQETIERHKNSVCVVTKGKQLIAITSAEEDKTTVV